MNEPEPPKPPKPPVELDDVLGKRKPKEPYPVVEKPPLKKPSLVYPGFPRKKSTP